MIDLILGSIAYLLFLLYDYLSLKQISWRWLMFLIGGIMLLGCTFHLCLINSAADRIVEKPIPTIIFLIISIAFFAGMIYVLFFSLPAEKTYTGTEQTQTVTSGAYGICRHPGVWMLAGFYAFLALAFPTLQMVLAFILFTLLDVIYVIIQDKFLFPKLLTDYETYKTQVPFLIPRFR